MNKLQKYMNYLEEKGEKNLIEFINKNFEFLNNQIDFYGDKNIKSVWASEFKGKKYFFIRFWKNNHLQTFKNLEQ